MHASSLVLGWILQGSCFTGGEPEAIRGGAGGQGQRAQLPSPLGQASGDSRDASASSLPGTPFPGPAARLEVTARDRPREHGDQPAPRRVRPHSIRDYSQLRVWALGLHCIKAQPRAWCHGPNCVSSTSSRRLGGCSFGVCPPRPLRQGSEGKVTVEGRGDVEGRTDRLREPEMLGCGGSAAFACTHTPPSPVPGRSSPQCPLLSAAPHAPPRLHRARPESTASNCFLSEP